jgi:plastocyanin
MGFRNSLFRVILIVILLQSCAQAALLIVNVSPPTTGNLSFSPANTVAAVGDQVRFEFALGTGNHTITQSAFATPCQPLSGGVDSGSKGAPDNVLV